LEKGIQKWYPIYRERWLLSIVFYNIAIKNEAGFLLHYQYCKLPICFDIGIREIRLAESMDGFLDLYNEVKKNV